MRVVKDSEEEMLLKLKEGSRTAFSLLYKMHVKRVYAFALKILKSPALAEDIVQEVFVRLWETAPQLDPKLSLQAYLFTIARNLALNVIRKAAKENDTIFVQRLFKERLISSGLLRIFFSFRLFKSADTQG